MDAAQTATLRYVEGDQAAATGFEGRVIIEGAPVGLGQAAVITQADGFDSSPAGEAIPSFLTRSAR